MRQEPSPGRFALTSPTLPSALPLAEAFTALELEFFRKGDELEATVPERPDPPADDPGEVWALPAAAETAS